MEFVNANGLRFAYLEEGSGPLVLILHGFPDTAHTWDYLRPELAKRGFRAVSPFMRGYSPTDVPDSTIDARVLGEDAVALVKALGEEEAILIGHDWGAVAAYAAVSLNPEVFKHVVVRRSSLQRTRSRRSRLERTLAVCCLDRCWTFLLGPHRHIPGTKGRTAIQTGFSSRHTSNALCDPYLVKSG